MKILFYHELRGEKDVTLEGVLRGTAMASGGMGRIRIALPLARAGHEVHVYHHLYDDAGESVIDGVRAVRIAEVGEFIRACRSLGGVDVVVVNQFAELPPLGRALRDVAAKKVIWAGCDIPFAWCDLVDQTHFHRLICVSNNSRQFYRLHSNFRYVEFIYTSAGFSAPAPAERVPGSVAFVGALREEKGFHHVLAAWPHIRARRPDARLAVFGSIRLHFPDAPVGATEVLTPEFESKHLQPILPPSGDWRDVGIDFMYPATKDKLCETLARTAVGIVNPNLTGSYETYCLSAVEMQGCGCPAVGGGIGGLLETIVGGETGFHLRTNDPHELADRVLAVLDDPALQKRLSGRAREHAAALLSEEREARDWLEVIARAKSGEESPRSAVVLADLGRFLGAGRLKIAVQRALGRGGAAY